MRNWMVGLVLGMLAASGCGQGSPGGEGTQPVTPSGQSSEQPEPGGLGGKKVVMIIARKDFRDEELFRPKEILEKAGAKVAVASSSLEPARGMLGGTAKPDLLVKDIRVSEYDAVVFVGGVGAREYWEDEKAQEIARGAAEERKVVAAICLGPVTLANAGVLEGKKATVWESEAGRLKAKGAIYTGRKVETDGRIITANGPQSAEEFGRALVKALGG
jgi:protease I